MDWKRLIDELVKKGESQSSISRRISVSQAQVCRLHNNLTKPRWEVGVALINLHRELCGTRTWVLRILKSNGITA